METKRPADAAQALGVTAAESLDRTLHAAQSGFDAVAATPLGKATLDRLAQPADATSFVVGADVPAHVRAGFDRAVIVHAAAPREQTRPPHPALAASNTLRTRGA